ncbi:hypothetical protein [Olleya namhaensis]|uniref:hypothetical protein n=1 Tax=Olleya namhaensis TaxID=1144750 RepID=UPI00249236D7|nr:hypothetical protein [Olleya namhaensis]
MLRKFKPGDWVKIRGKLNSPKMQVIKYVNKKEGVLGLIDSETYVECVWYKGGERKAVVFHQNKLIKTIDTGGLFKTFKTNSKLSLT